MAIISNFELLVKPIAKVPPFISEIGRTVVQGYFLEVSNLENRDISLIFRVKIPVKSSSSADLVEDRELVDVNAANVNHDFIYDITGGTSSEQVIFSSFSDYGELIPGKQKGFAYFFSIALPAGQTGMISLLPKIQFDQTGKIKNKLEIRGYAELVLASDITFTNTVNYIPVESAKILVSPEHRGTFIDPEFITTSGGNPLQTDLDFDQLAYGLPTANGRGLQELNTYANCNEPFDDFLTTDASLGRQSKTLSYTFDTFAKQFPKVNKAINQNVALKIFGVKTEIRFVFDKEGLKLDPKNIEKLISDIMKKHGIPEKSVPAISEITEIVVKSFKGDKEASKMIGNLIELIPKK